MTFVFYGLNFTQPLNIKIKKIIIVNKRNYSNLNALEVSHVLLSL